MQQFSILRDKTDVATFVIPFSNAMYGTRLAAGVSQSLAVPAGARIAILSASDHVVVGNAAVAVFGAAFAASNGALNYGAVDVSALAGVGSLYFIARQDTDVSVAFYS